MHPGGLLHVSKGMFAPAAAQNLILSILLAVAKEVLVKKQEGGWGRSGFGGLRTPRGFFKITAGDTRDHPSQSESPPQHALDIFDLNYTCRIFFFAKKFALVEAHKEDDYCGYYSLAVNFPRPRGQRGRCFSPARCPTRRPRAHSESRNLQRPRAGSRNLATSSLVPTHTPTVPCLTCTPIFFPLLHSFSRKKPFPRFTYIHYVYYVYSQHVFMQCPLLKKLAFYGRLAFRFVLASQEARFFSCPWYGMQTFCPPWNLASLFGQGRQHYCYF